MAIIDAQHCAMRPPEREPAMVGVVYNPPVVINRWEKIEGGGGGGGGGGGEEEEEKDEVKTWVEMK